LGKYKANRIRFIKKY